MTRLETPAMVGYRDGLNSAGVIGRKLSNVFAVEPALPPEMRDALHALRVKLTGAGEG